MRWIKIISGFILFYILLLWLVPKGNVIHEVLRIPHYQYKVQTRPCNKMNVVKYRFGAQRRQYLIHCSPKNNVPNNKPVVIYYHGGGWAFGTPEMFRTNAQFFVDRDYEVFMPSYRRIPLYSYPEIREDITLVLKQVLEIVEKSTHPNRKILLGGMSAGGNLAGLTLYDRTALNRLGVPAEKFAGLMLFGAPMDLSKMNPSVVLWSYAGNKNSETFRNASPVNHLQIDEKVPVLCVHGTKDGLVNYNSSISFVEKLEKINPGLVTFYTIENGTHLNSGSWNFEDNEIRSTLVEWLDEVVEKGY